MSERSELFNTLVFISVSAVIVIGLFLTSFYSYLLFHSIIELFSILVASAVFVIGWNSREENTFFRFIGVSYIFIAGLDILHTLSYSGTGIFPGYDANLPTQLWVLARYIEAGSLLVAPFILKKRVSRGHLLGIYLLLVGSLLISVFIGVFPDCFIVGEGLTPFKIGSEYIISGVLILAAYAYHKNKASFDPIVLNLLYASITFTIAAEMAFTLYADPYGLANMIGHYLRFVSYYFIYKAIVESSLIRPFEVMFRELKESEKSLIEANDYLELTTKMVRHDIRHELSVITLSIELYEQSKNDFLLAQAKESIARCTELIENTRKMTSGDEPKTKVHPTSVRETLLRAIGDSDLRVSIDGDGIVMAGAGLLSVFRNIVMNAQVHSKTDRLEITVTQKANIIETRISDFGIGIPFEIQDRVFEEGFTASDEGGLGLGLFIARKLIDSYKGTITVEPNQPSGTTFVVTLPTTEKI